MAERGFSAGMQTEIDAGGPYRPELLYEGEFFSPGGSPTQVYLRLWTGTGELEWSGRTWTGAGNLLEVSAIEETDAVRAVGFAVTLSGLPSENLSLALQSIRQGRSGKVWLALFDAAGAMVGEPYLLKAGRSDIAPIADDGKSCTIRIQYEDRLAALKRPRERRYTDEDQRLDYPDDLGFDQVAKLQDKNFIA